MKMYLYGDQDPRARAAGLSKSIALAELHSSLGGRGIMVATSVDSVCIPATVG